MSADKDGDRGAEAAVRRPRRIWIAILIAAFVAGSFSGVAIVAGGRRLSLTAAAPVDDLAALKASFRRPPSVPFPADNPYSEAKRALGETLFNERRLSADGSLSCASCHDPAKGFADSRMRSTGVPGRPLGRHTPTLWNLAFAVRLFWDGRARSLEEQSLNPIAAAEEMAMPLDAAVGLLAGDPAMARAFADAFPDDPRVSAGNLAKAIATYERTLVSPVTRFDRWIEGDAQALTAEEVDGFRLFTGKAGCANCHSGFAFTDYAFHDNGLPGDDRGRGAVLRLPAAEHAFKTPGLRELKRSAPYMHDGSLATLDDVIRHYESGIVERDTLSADLPRRLTLTPRERGALIAFLGTLSSDREPVRPVAVVPGEAIPLPPAARVASISQHDKSFDPTHVRIHAGERLWFLNNDTRTHNVRVFDPDLDFDSGAQEPGETVEIPFPKAGSFLVYCGIHPKMELRVQVVP